MPMKQYTVTFYSPGTFFAETTKKKIDSWDPQKALAMSKKIEERYHSHPYGFQFFTHERADDELDSHISDSSGTWYIDGVVKTLEDLKAEHNPENKILISNMECNQWDSVVQTRSPYSWTQPFEDGDHIIRSDGTIIR